MELPPTAETRAWRLQTGLVAGVGALAVLVAVLFPIPTVDHGTFPIGPLSPSLRVLLVTAAAVGALVYVAITSVLVAVLGRDRSVVAVAHVVTTVAAVFCAARCLRGFPDANSARSASNPHRLSPPRPQAEACGGRRLEMALPFRRRRSLSASRLFAERAVLHPETLLGSSATQGM